MNIRWKTILRIIGILIFLLSIIWFICQPGFEPLITLLVSIFTYVSSFFVENEPLKENNKTIVTLYDENCGSKGIDIGNQRLRVSSAFGSYFLCLLERDQSFIPLNGQIDCHLLNEQEGLSPLQRIFWSLQNPKGSKIIVIAAEGGMGKTTLATKLVRCLYEQEAIDMILGDSAKSEVVDPLSGRVDSNVPAYQTASSFYHRLCLQLGVPYENDEIALKDISCRLINRRAIVVVDNLDTVTHNDDLLKALIRITNRDIRAIITTRQVVNFNSQDPKIIIVHLNPLIEFETAREFVNWHINQFQNVHPALNNIRNSIVSKKQTSWLIEKSGGIPLLMQLLISDLARSSWDQIRSLPSLFGEELLNYLYTTRWQDLYQYDERGLVAQKILLWINCEQVYGRKVTLKKLYGWAQEKNCTNLVPTALNLLYERFLIINSDKETGNFAIFPSLSEYISYNIINK